MEFLGTTAPPLGELGIRFTLHFDVDQDDLCLPIAPPDFHQLIG
jgi:hypothetical protein